ncbi:MAG: ferritin-like domain-containing protein [Flavobacterium sp.]|nr:ferritin-like domain-containing protein [Pedobacter sp.]
MNLINIIEEIEKVDSDVYERFSPRRKAMKSFFNMGSKIALAAIPLSLGSMFKKAYGQTPTGILDVLNFALTLEHLEYNFYLKGCAKVGIPAGCDSESIKTIRMDEAKHVKFLETVIKSLGGTPVKEAKYDFTAKGTFPDVFTNYATFLAVAQAFEDTGVRAYKGQAGNLISSNEVLTAALQIHSVEARHASHIRWMRQQMGVDVKPWITGKESGIGAAVQASYDGEELDTQAGILITNINGKDIPYEAATECFDEPLTKEQVVAIVTPFFA